MEKLAAEDPPRIGAYRLLARLGAGGMGRVYLARSDRGRTVAVKLVRAELAEREEFRARFRQEVRAAQRVGGYWTAPVLDADTEAAVPWVATGYVAGPTLEQVVGHDHGALPERSVRILAAGLAHALADIHAAGIVHRDLKPSNVLVTIDGPRVIDFGIARALETPAGDGLTRTGSLVGSPGFMAPEQVRGDRITPACDVFCLGSVLAYAATGTLPFGAVDSGGHALMFRIAQEEPDLERVPEGLADLIRDCLRKDPAARPSLDHVLERTGAQDTVAEGRSRDPWLPGALVAQLGRHAVRLLETEDPEGTTTAPADAVPPVAPAPVAPAPVAPASPGPASPAAADGPESEWHSAGPPAPVAPESGAGPSPAVPAGPFLPAPAWTRQPPGGTGGFGGFGGVNGFPEHGQPADRADRLPYAGPGPVPPPAAPGASAGYGTPGPYGYPQQHGSQHPQSYPQQHPRPAASPYGYPQPYQPFDGGPGSAPPYGPPPIGGEPDPERRNGRSTALLVVIALIVALGAGGSVYALLRHGGDDTADGTPGPAPTTSGAPPTTSGAPTPTSPAPTSSAPADGVVPDGYLGTWRAGIDNANGANSRELTIRQGEVGDTVLTLVADGPTDGGGTYHCVFEAPLTAAPGATGPLRIGPSTVTSGEPASSCSPGEATVVTLLSADRLKRTRTNGGESLTYTKQ